MADNPHHEHLIKELSAQLEPVLSNSPQAVYVYLDDEHKFCNQKFAQLLGYSSPEQWAGNQYPVDDIDEADQQKGIKAYMDASGKYIASAIPATWVTKAGKKIHTSVIMAPFTYQNEVFVLHFISPVK